MLLNENEDVNPSKVLNRKLVSKLEIKKAIQAIKPNLKTKRISVLNKEERLYVEAHPLEEYITPRRRTGFVERANENFERRERRQTIIDEYRQGGEGFIRWAEDNVCIPLYPAGSTIPIWTPMSKLPREPDEGTGRSYHGMWLEQQVIVKRALALDLGRFKHRLIVFCWPRGDGKSFLACLIVIWKFMCWPKQLIVLGANSKDQVKFVHFDIISDIILHSPKLLAAVGRKNVKIKDITLRDSSGEIASSIRSISSYSGIVSNITCYTFSEMFEQRDPKFFEQLDGSIRNIPNAFGIIDSTVSPKDHILYKLFKSYMKGSDKSLYFSYRFSKTADQSDYMNPNMNDAQLSSYRGKMLPASFDQYFKNTWESAAGRAFDNVLISLIGYMGADGTVGNHTVVQELVTKKVRIDDTIERMVEKGIDRVSLRVMHRQNYRESTSRLRSLDEIYTLGGANSPFGSLAPIEAIDKLADEYDSDWAILAGMDRADPMKSRTSARTIVTFLLKGLPGSRSNRYSTADGMSFDHFYIYFLIGLFHIEDSSLEGIKRVLSEGQDTYGDIDSFCSERWGAWDLVPWCEGKNITPELIFPSYDKQKTFFTELFTAVRDGRFKAPSVKVAGAGKQDIFREELQSFDHNPDKRFFGSPTKRNIGGVQDDAVYSTGLTLFGGRTLTVDNLRVIGGKPFFGTMIPGEARLGR